MLTAAQMIEWVRVQEGSERVGSKKSEAKEKGEQANEGSKGKTPAPSLDPQKLLAEAKTWAANHQHVRALIDAELAHAKPAAGGTLGSTAE